MNRKQLGTLFAFVIIVGGAGLILRQSQNSSWSGGTATGKKLLGEFPLNEVARIGIRQGTNELNLVKTNDLWEVSERDGYPADFSQISGFLIKAQGLKIVQSEPVGPSQLPRLELSEQGSNPPVVVEFDDARGKLIHALLLGKKHMKQSSQPSQLGEGDGDYPDGRYVKVGMESPDVAVVKEPLENIEPKPDQWLDKDFFKVEKAKTVAVDFPAATNSWKLARETESGDWKLAGARPGEELDSNKISSVSSPLSSPAFDDVLLAAKPEFGLDKPTTVTIRTFDGFDYTVKVGVKTNDEYPITVTVAAEIPTERAPGKDEKPEDKARLDKEFKDRQQKFADKLKQEQGFGKWTYLVSSWIVEPLLKERSQLLVEKKDSKTASGPGGVTVDQTNPPVTLAPPVGDEK
jgi:hypothetical protein